MKRLNYKVNSENKITTWREIPFYENEPYIEVEDSVEPHVNFDMVIDGKFVADNEGYIAACNATKERLSKMGRISELKEKLAATDYQAIKYVEGELAVEVYLPIKEERKAWRAEINRLEEELKN